MENCIAKLTVEGVTDSFLLPIKIRSTKVNNGLVIADFENGFNHSYFSNFSCSVNINNNLMEAFQNCIKNNFVTEDRLSC